MTAYTDFHYSPTGSGVISGSQVLEQTEQGINGLGQYVQDNISGAIDTANQALTIAQTANTNATIALNTANSFSDAITTANQTANNALTTAQSAQSTANAASTLATTANNNATYAEGQISEEDYSAIKELRQGYRDRINELEALL